VGQGKDGVLQLGADLVIHPPHHLGRPGDPGLLQVGKEQVLLDFVVAVDPLKPGCALAQGLQGGAVLLFHQVPQLGDQGPEGGVLGEEGVDGVAGALRQGAVRVDDGVLKDGGVDLAQALHLGNGQAFVNQGLFRR